MMNDEDKLLAVLAEKYFEDQQYNPPQEWDTDWCLGIENEKKVIEAIRESNAIEKLYHDVSDEDVTAFYQFMDLENVTVDDMVVWVSKFQPDAELRDKNTVRSVRIGSHKPPPSSPEIRTSLEGILSNAKIEDPWHTHILYEILHPFTDCNGRSGRMLWWWCTRGYTQGHSFLQLFYYQTLNNQR